MLSLGCYRQVLRHFSKRTGAIRADSFIHTTAHLPCALSLFLDRVQAVIASASQALAGEKRIAVLPALYQSEQVRKNKPRLVHFTMHVLPAVACTENKNADLISTSFVVIRPAFLNSVAVTAGQVAFSNGADNEIGGCGMVDSVGSLLQASGV